MEDGACCHRVSLRVWVGGDCGSGVKVKIVQRGLINGFMLGKGYEAAPSLCPLGSLLASRGLPLKRLAPLRLSARSRPLSCFARGPAWLASRSLCLARQRREYNKYARK